MTVSASVGLLPLQAPLPTPRKYTLLDVAQLVDPVNDRWLGGAWINGFPPGPAATHDPFSTGTDRIKVEAGVIPNPMAGTFTVYLVGSCTAQSVGPDPTYWTDRLRLAFEAVEAQAVERVLATGDGHATLGAFLIDANMEELGSGAESPTEALALLEQAIAEANAGQGVIHATPATATYWASKYLVEPDRNLLRTIACGTPVVVGAGYIGAIPTGTVGAKQEWAFASGPIAVTRSEIEIMPTDYAQAIDRTMNDVTFLAERHYLINWVARQDDSDSDHVQAGVLVDRTE